MRRFPLEPDAEPPSMLVPIALVLAVIFIATAIKSSAGWTMAVMLGLAVAMAAVVQFGRERRNKAELEDDHVDIGADGLWLERRHRWMMIGWQEVQDVHRRGYGVLLKLTNGKLVSLRVGQPGALQHAVALARRRYSNRVRATPIAAFERGEESHRQWIERVGGLDASSEYRRARPSEDALARIVEDPGMSSAQRVGAAVALASAPRDAKRRVRVALDDTVQPELRDALRAGLDGELDEELCERVRWER